MRRLGLFGRHLPPAAQQAQQATMAGMTGSLTGPNSSRVLSTGSRMSRTYTSGDLVVQTFLRPASGPNDAESLQMAPVAINARRAVGRNRGYITDLTSQ